MKTIMVLTKEDININIVGDHVEIKTTDGTVINLSPDAMEELNKDFEKIGQLKKERDELAEVRKFLAK